MKSTQIAIEKALKEGRGFVSGSASAGVPPDQRRRRQHRMDSLKLCIVIGETR
jgi:hypothetical protein